MAGAIWAVGEVVDGALARVSTEAATLARGLGAASGRAVEGVLVDARPSAAAEDLAGYVARVLAVTEPATSDHAGATIVAERLAALVEREQPSLIVLGAGPEGRDTAGFLMALTGMPVLVNAVGVTWAGDGPSVEMSIFGGKLSTTSGFTTEAGIVTIRPNVVTAEPSTSPGSVEVVIVEAPLRLPLVPIRDRVSETGAAVAIEEAKVVVAGGRGVGGPEGFRLVEELAEVLGGAVGATRAAVNSGWINYANQIGQTGKIVKPKLYLALGVSGAIQHKVGMQTAETIVAINRDPDAPICDFADMAVIGDLFEVGPALVAALRERTG